MEIFKRIYFVVLVITLAFVGRLIPHAPNFVPMLALALFSGFYFKNKKYAILVPLSAMLISDVIIGFYDIKVMLSVYLSFGLVALSGRLLKNRLSFASIIVSSAGGAVLFFLVTNFAVWIFSGIYAHNLAGLMESYYLALPFFRNTLTSGLFYSALFFGAYDLAFSKKIILNLKQIYAKASI